MNMTHLNDDLSSYTDDKICIFLLLGVQHLVDEVQIEGTFPDGMYMIIINNI